jgi:hypothetical protein
MFLMICPNYRSSLGGYTRWTLLFQALRSRARCKCTVQSCGSEASIHLDQIPPSSSVNRSDSERGLSFQLGNESMKLAVRKAFMELFVSLFCEYEDFIIQDAPSLQDGVHLEDLGPLAEDLVCCLIPLFC